MSSVELETCKRSEPEMFWLGWSSLQHVLVWDSGPWTCISLTIWISMLRISLQIPFSCLLCFSWLTSLTAEEEIPKQWGSRMIFRLKTWLVVKYRHGKLHSMIFRALCPPASPLDLLDVTTRTSICYYIQRKLCFDRTSVLQMDAKTNIAHSNRFFSCFTGPQP